MTLCRAMPDTAPKPKVTKKNKLDFKKILNFHVSQNTRKKNEKITQGKGENICELYILQELYIQNI